MNRAFAAQNGSDVVVNADNSAIGDANAASYLAAIDAMPEVRDSARLGGVFLEEITADGKVSDALNTGSASAKLLDQTAIDDVGKFRLLHGRLPVEGRADEVVVNPTLLAATGWKVGDTIPKLRLYHWTDLDENGEPDPTKGSEIAPLHIVGEVIRPEEFLDDASSRQPQIYLYPAFGAAYPDSAFYTNDYIRLVGGREATVAFRAKVQALAATYENNQFYFVSVADGLDRAQQALRPQIVAWLLLAAVSFGAAILIVAQTIGRRLFADNRDLGNLHALGMTRREVTLSGILQAVTIALATVVIAVILGLLSSRFTPLGAMHDVEPHIGLRADTVVLLGGGLVMMLVLAALTWIPAHATATAATSATDAEQRQLHSRPSRVIAALTRTGAPPTMVVGSGFALQGGRDRASVRVRGIFATAALAVAVLVTAVAFSGDLHHLVGTPRLYGWDWDVGIVNSFGSIPDDAITAAKSRAEVGDIAGFTMGSATIDGHVVATVGIDQLRGTVFPTLDRGHRPLSDGEIVLGELTLSDLHKSVGDSVDVETSAGKHTLTIVGVATFPELGPNHLSGTALGRGAAVTVNVLPAISDYAAGRYSGMFIRLDQHHDNPAAVAALQAFVIPLGCTTGCFVTDLRPAQLKGYSDLGNIWLPFVVVLGLLFLISLAYGILWATAVRNRDLRILTALGFGRWQIAATITWQALTIAVIALVGGTALGLIAANAAWHVFTDRLGIRPSTWSSPLELGIVWAAVLVGAVLVGLCAVPGATRTRPLQ
jgi:FtsX-like permease family